jgi:hypothetical protein
MRSVVADQLKPVVTGGLRDDLDRLVSRERSGKIAQLTLLAVGKRGAGEARAYRFGRI